MRNLLDIVDFSVDEINKLMEKAEDIAENKKKYADSCKGKKLATLFFEPSTRTRISFEAAMLELGGSVIGFADPNSSSASKGECVRDTVRVIGNYADIIAMRHPYEGAPYVAVTKSPVPIINAGDGGHCHPTQTLADMLTIHREIRRMDNLTIGFCGDLKYGRTVHSLINAMIRYKNNKFILISPSELKLPIYMLDTLKKAGASYIITDDMEKYMAELDILYMTRVQRERFDSAADYDKVKDCYILTPEKLHTAKSTMRILHPLPRVNEISQKVDDDPRAAYFRQTENGKLMRMALILKLLDSLEYSENREKGVEIVNLKCKNPKCITHKEQELAQSFVKSEKGDNIYKCVYCESELKKD